MTVSPSRPEAPAHPEFLNRRAASAYILHAWGVSRTAKTLAKIAVTGNGPRYCRIGKMAFYTPADLDEWVRSLVSEAVSNTSQRDVGAGR